MVGRTYLAQSSLSVLSRRCASLLYLLGREKRQLLCKHCVAVVSGIQKLFDTCGNVGSLDEFVDM